MWLHIDVSLPRDHSSPLAENVRVIHRVPVVMRVGIVTFRWWQWMDEVPLYRYHLYHHRPQCLKFDVHIHVPYTLRICADDGRCYYNPDHDFYENSNKDRSWIVGQSRYLDAVLHDRLDWDYVGPMSQQLPLVQSTLGVIRNLVRTRPYYLVNSHIAVRHRRCHSRRYSYHSSHYCRSSNPVTLWTWIEKIDCHYY